MASLVPGSVWRDWQPHNLARNTVSLCGELLGSVELHRVGEADRSLQAQVLPRLVFEVRARYPGGTRLHYAANMDYLMRARTLLASGADPRAPDRFGAEPLRRNAESEHGSGAVGTLLVRDEAAYPLPALQAAVSSGEALHWASFSGFAGLVEALLERGVEPNTRNLGRETGLHSAAQGGCTRVIELLLEAGVELDSVDECGSSPLLDATRNGHVDAVRLLLDRGAALNHRDREGSTALWWACRLGHLEVAQLLVERGADITLKGRLRHTPLAVARLHRHASVVAWLEGVPAAQ